MACTPRLRGAYIGGHQPAARRHLGPAVLPELHRSSRKCQLCLLTAALLFPWRRVPPPPLCPLSLVAVASEERPGLRRLWRGAPGSPPSSWPPNGPPSPGVRGAGSRGPGRVCPTARGQGSARRARPGPGLASPRRTHLPEETHGCPVGSLLSDFKTRAKNPPELPALWDFKRKQKLERRQRDPPAAVPAPSSSGT